MLSDRFGLPLTTASRAAADAYVAGADCLFAAAIGADRRFDEAIAADPGFALAHVGRARTRVLVGDVAAARASAAEARSLAAGATARERSHVDALCLAIEGRPADALAATRAHLAEHPRDAMVATPVLGVFGLLGFSGRQEREPELLAFIEALRPELGDDWWFQQYHAFALNECGRLDEALASIERALARKPESAHGAHIKAHVLYEMGEDRAAFDYLSGWMPAYPREGLMHCHLSWHHALLALALGRMDEAWRLYRTQVHPGGSWGPPLNTVTDSVAFLWRAELAGAPRQSDLWRAVADHAGTSFPQPGVGFADVHRALACIVAEDDPGLRGLLEAIGERIAGGRYPMGDVIPALAAGFAAYRHGRWSEAIAILGAALPRTVRIGGSRAQRDLAELTLVAAYLRDGRPAEARRLIAARIDRRPTVAVAGYA